MNNYKIQIQQKDSEWSGLLKVPDNVIISSLRTEIGQLKSYINELEYQLKSTKKDQELNKLVEDNKQLRLTIKAMAKQHSKDQLNLKNIELKKENNKIKNERNELIGKVYRLEQQIKL